MEGGDRHPVEKAIEYTMGNNLLYQGSGPRRHCFLPQQVGGDERDRGLGDKRKKCDERE